MSAVQPKPDTNNAAARYSAFVASAAIASEPASPAIIAEMTKGTIAASSSRRKATSTPAPKPAVAQNPQGRHGVAPAPVAIESSLSVIIESAFPRLISNRTMIA